MAIELIYWLCFVCLLFNFSGYILVLAWVRRYFPTELHRKNDVKLSKITVLVPFFNEADLIKRKLDNLSSLIYDDDKVTFYLIDGGSTDGCQELARIWCNESSNRRLIVSESPSKIKQLNEALRRSDKDSLIVVTDCDSIISPPDALHTAAKYFTDKNIGLVGGWGLPDARSAMQIETAFWDKQNRLRYLEMCSYSSSIVTALFYVFRRNEIESFPENCVADDVYASCITHVSGKRVLYLSEIEATELRQATNIRDLFRQKLRKANAYSVELLRVIFLLPQIRKRVRYILIQKIFQFFYLPWISILFIFLTADRLLKGMYLSFTVSTGILFASLFIASLTVAPPPNRSRGGIRLKAGILTVISFSFVNFVLVLNSILFPFWRPNSNYRRVA